MVPDLILIDFEGKLLARSIFLFVFKIKKKNFI